MKSLFAQLARRWRAAVPQTHNIVFAIPSGIRSLRLELPEGRTIAIASVTALHMLVALLFFSSLTDESSVKRIQELQVNLGPPVQQAKPDLPRIPELPMPVLEPPHIVVRADEGMQGALLAPASMVLAPRPDPAHPNLPPSSADTSAGSPVHLLVLRILVLPTGSIGDATVLRSSGKIDEDTKAAQFVKTNWHFLPAMLEDQAVKYWTVISVRI